MGEPPLGRCNAVPPYPVQPSAAVPLMMALRRQQAPFASSLSSNACWMPACAPDGEAPPAHEPPRGGRCGGAGLLFELCLTESLRV